MANGTFPGMRFYDLGIHGTGVIDVGVALCGIFCSRAAGGEQEKEEQERGEEANFEYGVHN
jgi:hypothetical protein